MDIKIKYFTEEIEKIAPISKGDWIDLRAAQKVELKAGEFKLIPLGVAMQLPAGYEAHVCPRSSTFKNFGVIQTNSMGPKTVSATLDDISVIMTLPRRLHIQAIEIADTGDRERAATQLMIGVAASERPLRKTANRSRTQNKKNIDPP